MDEIDSLAKWLATKLLNLPEADKFAQLAKLKELHATLHTRTVQWLDRPYGVTG